MCSLQTSSSSRACFRLHAFDYHEMPFYNKLCTCVQQRKLLSKKEYKGRHHNWGGLIMGLGTATAVAGPVNTYLRSGMQHAVVHAAISVL